MTVCPPKNTYTDLNYDLLISENITLTEEMRNDMFKYALEVLKEEESFFQSNWTKLNEKDRFYNWYQGYTAIQRPYYSYTGLNIKIETSATSGVIFTKYYGEKYQPDLVERKLQYSIFVYPPESVLNNENVTLHFKVEKVLMKGIKFKDWVEINRIRHDGYNNTVLKNFTPPSASRFIRSRRDMSSKNIEQLKLDVMPGFRFSWWYTGHGVEIKPYPKFRDEDITKHFVR